MYKVYANTVNDGVAFLAGSLVFLLLLFFLTEYLGPAKSRPKLQAFFTEKMNNDPDCKGLDFASYLTSPVKRTN